MSKFWNQADLEPKRGFKFTLEVGGDADIMFIVKDAQRPSFSIGEGVHDFLGKKFYYPGSIEWDPVDVTLVEPISRNAVSKMKNILVESGYTWIDGQIDPNSLATISKKRAVEALGNVIVTTIDSDGNAVDTWQLQNPWIQKVEPSAHDYTDEDLANLTLTFRYDYAEVESRGETGVAGVLNDLASGLA